jgi:predicted dehydrogenase
MLSLRLCQDVEFMEDVLSSLGHQHKPPIRSDYAIGAVGAGFIMRDVQLVAYRNAGFQVHAIASRSCDHARAAADLRGVPVVHERIDDLIADPSIEILDIALPPDQQLGVVKEAASRPGPKLKGILAQKPLGYDYDQARQITEICADAGITLAVNQNMRWDQSIRALKALLDRGDLGEPVLGTIEMRAVPHWQPWLEGYGRLTLLNMSVHHLDTFRFLFGTPDSLYVSARQDPRTRFAHADGICLYILEYANGFRVSAWDDVWAGPAPDRIGPYIKWRVEGTEGLAEGSIGWPGYPNRQPSTIRYYSNQSPGVWVEPRWSEVWFPDAFSGPMAELMDAITENRAPSNSGVDNLQTMALVEAGYRSLAEHRVVNVREITGSA